MRCHHTSLHPHHQNHQKLQQIFVISPPLSFPGHHFSRLLFQRRHGLLHGLPNSWCLAQTLGWSLSWGKLHHLRKLMAQNVGNIVRGRIFWGSILPSNLASCLVISSMFVGPMVEMIRLLAKLSFPFQPRLETCQDLLPLFGGGSTAQTLNKGLGFPMDSWISLHCDFVPSATPFARKWVKIKTLTTT